MLAFRRAAIRRVADAEWRVATPRLRRPMTRPTGGAGSRRFGTPWQMAIRGGMRREFDRVTVQIREHPSDFPCERSQKRFLRGRNV